MSDSHPPDRDRLMDLLADRSVQPLSDTAAAELAELLQQFEDVAAGDDASGLDEFNLDEFELEYAASAMSAAFEDGSQFEPLAPELAAKIEQDAKRFFDAYSNAGPQMTLGDSDTPVNSLPVNSFDAAAASSIPVTGGTSGFSVREAIAWFAAAAALLFALGVFDQQVVPPTAGQRMSALAETANDLIDLRWKATEDPSAKSADGSRVASGKITWSTERQEGYMTFADLEQNDPSIFQYQLWIFDKSQEDPIDGGVFDVIGDKVIVPIDSKLRTVDVYQFAVTIEKPGGVVKSKKERIAVLAAL